jgi:MFS family permease
MLWVFRYAVRTTAPARLRTGGLARYLFAASLARGADAGAIVGLVLLAFVPPERFSQPALVGALLAACLTVPHLLGPLAGNLLDRANDPRRVLAAAFALYGLALAAATLAVGSVPLPLVCVLVLLTGACGPLLTGGLSSELAGLVAPDERAQRRAQGWDALSYGVAGSAGPAAVAGLAAVTGPVAALLLLSVAAVLAGGVALMLPRAVATERADAISVIAALRVIVVVGPLRRAAYTTMVIFLPGGAVEVLAVGFARHLGAGASAGAVLVAVFGLGNCVGSLVVTAFPLTGEPDRLLTRCALVVAAGFGACALAPDYPLAIVAFALAGVVNAPLFAATLATRSAYAPAEARAQVFVTSAALKVGAASLGTTLAGALAGLGPRFLLAIGAALCLAVTTTATLDRRLTASATSRQAAPVPR